jgi:hypothetical protein
MIILFGGNTRGENEVRRGSTELRAQGTDRRLTGKAGVYRGAQIEARVCAITEELFEVVSAHAPVWFEQRRHNRIVGALKAGGEKLPRAFFELFELLEDYAPRWYGKDLHDKAERLFRELHTKEKAAQAPRNKRAGQPPNL